MAKVELINIRKVYDGGVVAVQDANVTIEDKEFVVFVGPSGCGKSTTLRMVAGLEDISDGKLLIDGEVVNNLPPKDRNIAMVFQNYALYPHMTVYDNMAFGLRIRGVPEQDIRTRVENAAAILDITQYLKRKPKALSGGQRQRVAVGRAIVREPKVFLFDEPLSNLDAKLRVQMRAEISKLHHRLSATMIYVTHDQVEAMTMGDKIVVMKDGIIQQIGAPLLLYDYPANQFVASFIGSPPMNFLEGTLTEENGILRVVGRGFSFSVAPNHRETLMLHNGSAVTVGIRPELFSITDAATETSDYLEAAITVIEELGSEAHIYMAREYNERENIIARVEQRHNYAIGDKIRIVPDAERINYFDPASGKSLLGITGPVRASSRKVVHT